MVYTGFNDLWGSTARYQTVEGNSGGSKASRDDNGVYKSWRLKSQVARVVNVIDSPRHSRKTDQATRCFLCLLVLASCAPPRACVPTQADSLLTAAGLPGVGKLVVRGPVTIQVAGAGATQTAGTLSSLTKLWRSRPCLPAMPRLPLLLPLAGAAATTVTQS